MNVAVPLADSAPLSPNPDPCGFLSEDGQRIMSSPSPSFALRDQFGIRRAQEPLKELHLQRASGFTADLFGAIRDDGHGWRGKRLLMEF
jgi:hypothetical protein